jgi:hypothetical protein
MQKPCHCVGLNPCICDEKSLLPSKLQHSSYEIYEVSLFCVLKYRLVTVSGNDQLTLLLFCVVFAPAGLTERSQSLFCTLVSVFWSYDWYSSVQVVL